MSLINIEQSHLNLPQSLKHVHPRIGYLTQIITPFKCVKSILEGKMTAILNFYVLIMFRNNAVTIPMEKNK